MELAQERINQIGNTMLQAAEAIAPEANCHEVILAALGIVGHLIAHLEQKNTRVAYTYVTTLGMSCGLNMASLPLPSGIEEE